MMSSFDELDWFGNKPSMVWLQTEIDDNGMKNFNNAKLSLNNVYSSVEMFDNFYDCLQRIRKSSFENLVLVLALVNKQAYIAVKIILLIHHLAQLRAIYIYHYHSNNSENELEIAEWMSRYYKIQAVSNNFGHLLTCIASPQFEDIHIKRQCHCCNMIRLYPEHKRILIWLHPSGNTKYGILSFHMTASFIHSGKFDEIIEFDDIELCELFLRIKREFRIILIISIIDQNKDILQSLIPGTHHLPQLTAIHLYYYSSADGIDQFRELMIFSLINSSNCRDESMSWINELALLTLKDKNECGEELMPWIINFAKIRSVTNNIKQLICYLEADATVYPNVVEKNEEKSSLTPIDMYHTTLQMGSSTIPILPQQLVHVELSILIDMIVGMVFPDDVDLHLKCVDACIHLYGNGTNDGVLAQVREFEHDYNKERAVYWYTRDSFVYRMLNKAFRYGDMDFVFLFDFFIRDLYVQLEQLQSEQRCESHLIAYRGQMMYNHEINSLRNHINEHNIIVMDTIISTTLDKEIAILFLQEADEKYQRVLLEIDIDRGIATRRPYADISSRSNIPDEGEVLFMIGSTFRIVDILNDQIDNCTLIKIQLCDGFFKSLDEPINVLPSKISMTQDGHSCQEFTDEKKQNTRSSNFRFSSRLFFNNSDTFESYRKNASTTNK